jgi:hypothetical protein
MNDMRLYRELDELPTLAEGQAEDLKLDTMTLETGVDFDHGADVVRVWTSRVEPGEIEAERRIDGRWVPGDDNDILVVVAAARLDGVL